MPLDMTVQTTFADDYMLPDLDNNPDDRYKCAQDIKLQARIASSSSTVYMIKIYKDAAPSTSGNEYRRVLRMYVPQMLRLLY